MEQSYSLRPSENTDWITSLEAVHLLSHTLGSDKRAKKAITERLMDGAVDATAWWLAEGLDVGHPYVPKPMVFEGTKPLTLSPDDLHDLIVETSKPKISQTRVGTNIARRVDSGNLFLGKNFWDTSTDEDRSQWDWAFSKLHLLIRKQSPAMAAKKMRCVGLSGFGFTLSAFIFSGHTSIEF